MKLPLNASFVLNVFIFVQTKENDTEDKETNTDSALSNSNKENGRVPTIVIKRSQTFSPTAKNQYFYKVS